MYEAKVTKKDNVETLTVYIPLQEPKLSTSEKNYVFATTGGNKECTVQVKGKTLKVGINAYYKA